MKKVLSVLLTLAMIFSLIPMGTFTLTANALTEGYYTYSVTDGKATITAVDTSISGDVTIPSTLGGYTVTSIGTRAFAWCENITSITIPDGVISIDEGAFDCCTGVQTITIPDSVTSIGERAFAWCENLTSITIPGGVTSIGESMFYYCSKLTSVTLPSSVTNIGRSAFEGCASITSIVIPNGVTSISEYAFFDCQAMTSITLPDSITSIGNYAFLDTGYYLNEDNWEDNVLYIGKHLIKANSSIIDDCIVKDGTLTIADYAFAFREELTGIVISNSVKNIGECAFGGCAALESITVDSGNTVFHSEGNCLIDTENKVLVAGCKNSNIPTDDSVTSIGDYAFYGNYEVTNITIPENITSIGWCSFAECGALAKIIIPDSITSIGEGAFEECASLTDVWYGGSMSDREKLDLADGNDYLIGSTWHYDFCKEHTYIGFFDRSCDSCGWERDDRSVPTSAHLLEMQQNMLGITNFPYGYFDINLDEYFNATDLVILQMFILGL